MSTTTQSLRILRITELTKVLGISRSSIYEKLNPRSKYYDDTFPKPLKLGASSVGWLYSEIEKWVASREV
ncbi:helix-turn-helix transcriptional regulator [Providencia vermicola]|uniref:Predicted transcriptional regulator n=1 Tax=Providencia rettgeri TaxID=587 RepID=A0A379FTU6_PRORE|nr:MULTISPECIES: AlpA family phage regulatory protein [Morganellaceae]AXO17980.1 AlpA family phage regulatory protein [Providencia stuartii]EJD6399556.1 AlpA family phage regulatory protein [Providencia rettgeri]ELQ1455142.1 AlpA family phage regulatory protein [Providencia rettgeri]ELR5261938.1 AlpA family phage regulatory protein [Providencia rettgeri]ELZ9638156.1 AlpA family phage regulatory protein [Proteus mirabilis]